MISLDSCFFDIIHSALPSIPLDKIDNIKRVIDQFNLEGKKIEVTNGELLENFSQGDLITNIPFIYYDKNGKQSLVKYNAIVLSNTCDIQRNRNLLFAPVFPIEQFYSGSALELKKNHIYEFMFFDDNRIGESYINFGFINSIDRIIVNKGIEEGRYKRIASLTDVGYYLLIIKLTVFLLRNEDSENFALRKKSN